MFHERARSCSRSPVGVFGERCVGVLTVALDRGSDTHVRRDADVADNDQSIAAHQVKVAVGDVPPAVAILDPVVGAVKQFEGVDPRLRLGRQRDRVALAEPHGDRADVLAVVAAVDAVVDGRSVFEWESNPGAAVTQLRQRLPSMTPGAMMASVGQPSKHLVQLPHPSGATRSFHS